MTDPEGFLSRWSRLKREADEAAEEAPALPDAAQAAPVANAPNETAGPEERSDKTGSETVQAEATAVDLAKLPPIDSITAATDIRAFLASGVPAQLTSAALRRAWAADPAIRDFVGLAENAWDFTAPDGVPGFGPILPGDDVQRVVAEVVEEMHSRSVPTPVENDEPLRKPEVSKDADAQPRSPAVEEAPVSEVTGQETGTPTNIDAAMQKEKAEEEAPHRLPRRHGGALPRYDESS